MKLTVSAEVVLAEQHRWRWPETVFWLAIVSCPLLFPDYLVLASQILISGLFALSLDLILGYTGIASLGHAAFFGIGAYTAGLLAKMVWHEPITGMVLSGFVAGMFGLLCSTIIARVQGIALLMVTLGMGMMLYEAANRVRSVTGGDDGLQGIVVAPIFGRFDFDFYGRTAYVYVMAVTFLLFLATRRLVNSPFGLSLRGIKQNVRRVPALGVSVRRRVMAVFTISAAMAGIAGALLAQATQFVAPDVLGFDRSAGVLIMLVMGGIGTLYGAFVGAALFMIARDLLSEADPFYWYFWLGILLVGIVSFGRGGIVGGAKRGWASVARLAARPS